MQVLLKPSYSSHLRSSLAFDEHNSPARLANSKQQRCQADNSNQRNAAKKLAATFEWKIYTFNVFLRAVCLNNLRAHGSNAGLGRFANFNTQLAGFSLLPRDFPCTANTRLFVFSHC